MATTTSTLVAGAGDVVARYEADLFLYAGPVNDSGFAELIRISVGLAARRNCLFILVTNGGSAKTAYRIGHYLQGKYAKLTICVPSHCKSAGALIALAGHDLIMDDFSELGPLDLMASPAGGELRLGWGHASTLEHLSDMQLETFRKFTASILTSSEPVMSLKQASRLALALTAQSFGPLFSQINVQALGQDLRDHLAIAEYARRLTERSRNVLPNAVSRLIRRYPSHDFLIDQDEARTLFSRVEAPAECLYALIDSLGDVIYTDPASAHVTRILDAARRDEDVVPDEPVVRGAGHAHPDASPFVSAVGDQPVVAEARRSGRGAVASPVAGRQGAKRGRRRGRKSSR